MSLTINEMYQAAAKGETSWEHALLLTGLLYMNEAGLEVSPPPSSDACYHYYKLRLEALSEYPNNNSYYNNVVQTLHNYINNKDLISTSTTKRCVT